MKIACQAKITPYIERNIMAGLEQIQGLHLQQTLSPQMQQSLQILQAPLLDLRQVVARELMENPVLEEERPNGLTSTIPSELQSSNSLTEAWEPYYEQQRLTHSSEASERHQFLMDSLTRPPTLQEVVRSQIAFLPLTPSEQRIAASIAGNLGPNGYLEAKLEEIAAQNRTTPLRVEEVLEHLQRVLEPPGLAARTLQECLILQLRREGLGDSIETSIIKRFLPQLAKRRLQEIAKSLKQPLDTIQAAILRISRLDPNPARGFESEPNMVITPEVFVEKDGDGFSIRLNTDELPALRISNHYKDLLGETKTKDVKEYLREKIRGGRFFLRTLEQRNETILTIAREIVERQNEFMNSGAAFLKPMTMSTVAESVGVHETTISRAVSNKYMSTPHGLFEMKYFFTSGYTTESGESISNESVRKAISDLVAGEDLHKPFSDEQLVRELQESGIKVARRTIAKYREQLHIPPSHLRKR